MSAVRVLSARVVGASAAGVGSGILELPFQMSDATLEGIHLIVVIIWYRRIRHDGRKASNNVAHGGTQSTNGPLVPFVVEMR